MLNDIIEHSGQVCDYQYPPTQDTSQCMISALILTKILLLPDLPIY